MNTLLGSDAKLLIIGDDLSGTADCAVTCTHHGLRSVVTLGAERPNAGDVDVLAVDMDTRRYAPSEAARANTHAWNLFANGRRVYKKIDSTLRGNVAAEVAALSALAGMAIVAPGFPQAGRTTRNGHQFVFGVPVEASEVWRNERKRSIIDVPLRVELRAMNRREAWRVLSAGKQAFSRAEARRSRRHWSPEGCA
ncbi:uncharacterized protein YgbK (DUF1537 family) [Paraburkholderia youngii]|uniref:four-carbon acid sugar kinase family protein n=1 Tax=Paraburkholderia youngii TaxID=2782701 RepID=UPI003D1AB31E